jgi:pilus assembly protein Flp/PilA
LRRLRSCHAPRACAAFIQDAAHRAPYVQIVNVVQKGRTVAMQSPANVLSKIAHVLHGEDGQDLVEYGLLMALIAVIAMGAVATVGTTINTVFWQSIAVASSF